MLTVDMRGNSHSRVLAAEASLPGVDGAGVNDARGRSP